MPAKEQETICPTGRAHWRQWLAKYHQSRQSIWLIYYKKSTGKATVSYSEAVDEALCFGWIDSTRNSLDDERFIQFFCRRKPKSVWSRINKEKVERLIAEGLMTDAGYASIETAKQNGSWTILDEVEKLTVPKDLAAAFRRIKGSKAYFNGLSPSARKAILQWVVLAKRPETRLKRIEEIATLAGQGLKPMQFR